MGEPILCSTLILPGEDEALWNPDEVEAAVGNDVDLVISGPVGMRG